MDKRISGVPGPCDHGDTNIHSWYTYSCVATRTMGQKRILGLGKEILVLVTMEIQIFTASLFLQEHTHLVQTPGLIGNWILIPISFQYKYSFVVTRTMGWKGSSGAQWARGSLVLVTMEIQIFTSQLVVTRAYAWTGYQLGEQLITMEIRARWANGS